jgi:hypothetical protein
MQRGLSLVATVLLSLPVLAHGQAPVDPAGAALDSPVQTAQAASTSQVPAAAAPEAAAPEAATPATAVARPERAEAAPSPSAAGRQGRHSVEVAYFGQNFVRPGAQVGYSLRALQSPARLHALVVGVDVGAYAWLRHDFGVFVLPRIGWRGRHRVGLQGEASVHLGYLQSLLASPAYQVEGGQVVEASRAGIANLLFGVSSGVGWFFPRAGVTPFARVGAVWHTPVFDQVLLRFVLNLGVEVRL